MHPKAKIEVLLEYNVEILKAWQHISVNPEDKDGINIAKVSLWHNSKIVDKKNKPLYFSAFSKAGVNVVGDLFDSYGKLIKSYGSNPKLFLAWRAVCEAVPIEGKLAIKKHRAVEDKGEEPEPSADVIGLFQGFELMKIKKVMQEIALKALAKRM